MKQRGFSFLEVLVAIAVIGAGAYVMMETLTNTGNENENVTDRILANQILQQNLSSLRSSSGMFPYVVSPAGKPGVYITCSDRKGEATKNAAGQAVQTISLTSAAGTPSGVCTGSEVEAQYSPSATDASLLTVYILFYARGGSGKLISTHLQTIHLDRNI